MVIVITVILLFAFFMFVLPKIMENIGEDSFSSVILMFIIAILAIFVFISIGVHFESP